MVTNLPTDPVAADMDRIFKPLAKRGLASAMPLDRAGPGKKSRGGRRWRGLTIVAPVLVVAASTMLAVGYVRQDTPHPAVTATTVPDSTSFRSSTPPSAAVQTVALVAPSVRTGSEMLVDADGNRTMEPRAPAIEPLRRTTGEAGDAATRAIPADRRARSTPSSTPTAAEAVRPARGGSAAAGCAPGSLEDRCIYQDVLNADARLRLAYSRARRSGVSVRQLTAVNRRWIRARELSLDDPDGTIERYDALSDMLDRARRDLDE
jgi:uncharacterized protein YecT (DUF1311 family)